MLYKKTGILKTHFQQEKIANLMIEHYANDDFFKIQNKERINEGTFTLKPRIKFFDIFQRKLMLVEINGEICDNELNYKIEMSSIMQLIMFIDCSFLFVLSLMFLSDTENALGLAIFLFLFLLSGFIYFWLKSEVKYCEKIFLQKM